MGGWSLRTPGPAALVLAVAVAAVYAPSLAFPFVYEDANDFQAFYRDVAVDEVLVKPLRALTQVTLIASQWVGGGDPWAYRAGNVAFHAANSVLLLLLAWRLWSPSAAVFAAALFALHPLQVEAVTYVSSRSDLVGAVGVLLALHAATLGSVAGAILGVVLAVLGKDTYAVAAGLVLLWAAWASPAFPWRRGVVLGSVGVVVAGAAAWLLRVPVALDGAHLLTALASIWWVASSVVLPWGFTIDHDWLRLPVWWLWTSVVLTVTAGLWTLWWGRRSWLAFGVLWMLVSLAPRLFVPGVEWLHEHHFYLPMIGLCLCAGAWVSGSTARERTT